MRHKIRMVSNLSLPIGLNAKKKVSDQRSHPFLSHSTLYIQKFSLYMMQNLLLLMGCLKRAG